jgi:hypothetical protein
MIKKAKELARMGLVGEIFANFTAQKLMVRIRINRSKPK